MSTNGLQCVKTATIRVFSGSCFPAFLHYCITACVLSPNAGKYGPKKTPNSNAFDAVWQCLRNEKNSL